VTDGDALPLSTADAAAEEATDDGVDTLVEAERGDHRLHALRTLLLAHTARQSQCCGIAEGLPHGQGLQDAE